MSSVAARACSGTSRTNPITSGLTGGRPSWYVRIMVADNSSLIADNARRVESLTGAYQNGPIYLTPEELAAYDGSDPEKPLYLAINHTIYDVSNGRHIYGPGGSYQYFGGCDAARAYVTGCFADDRTPDMRGVEEMYLPIDDPETDAHWTAAELAELKQKE